MMIAKYSKESFFLFHLTIMMIMMYLVFSVWSVHVDKSPQRHVITRAEIDVYSRINKPYDRITGPHLSDGARWFFVINCTASPRNSHLFVTLFIYLQKKNPRSILKIPFSIINFFFSIIFTALFVTLYYFVNISILAFFEFRHFVCYFLHYFVSILINGSFFEFLFFVYCFLHLRKWKM